VTTAIPTLEGDARLYGVAVTRVEYPPGIGGVRLSLTEIAKRTYEGSRAPSMKAFAEFVVRNWAGIPANVQLTNRRAAQILLDYVRASVRYRPDPPGTEYTQSAAVTLCVPGAPMCIPVEDCDGMVVALATLCAAYGIPVRVIKQFFGGDQQEHVLVSIQDDSGEWLGADPSAPDKPVGWKAYAQREDVIDPSDPSSIGLVGAPEAEFIGVGRVGHWHGRVRVARSVVQLVGHGLGHAGLAQAPVAPSYQLVTDRRIYSTNRYRIGMLVNFLGNQNVPAAGQRGMILTRLESDWTVEQLSPSGDVTGGLQSWILQGIAKNDFTLQDTSFLTYSVVAAEVSPAPPAPPAAEGGNVGAAKVAAIAGLFGLAAWWGAPKVFRKSRRRRAA
jgi:Transglutaminase-like superfamily